MKVDISFGEYPPTAKDVKIGETFLWSSKLYMRVQPSGFYIDNLLMKGAMAKENIHCVSLSNGALIVLSEDTKVELKKCKVVDEIFKE